MNFNTFIEEIKTNNWNVHGVEVYEDGMLVQLVSMENGDRSVTFFLNKSG